MGDKNAMGATGKTDLFLYEPEGLTLVTDKAHPLYDPRISLPLDEALVRNIMVFGVLEPILVTKAGDQILVVDGRQRVVNAREANRRLVESGRVP